jgi:hypothetical protein
VNNTRPFAWSYSALTGFETCPKRHWHYNIAKDIKEEENSYQREGTDTHAAFDRYLKDQVELPLGLGHWKPMLDRIINGRGKVYSERKLALSSSFQPVGWFSDQAWFRGILDCTSVNDNFAAVLDWKTGKPSFDQTQLKLSAALVFASAPNVNLVRAGLVFINHDRVERSQYRRAELPAIWNEILPRVKKMQQAREKEEYPAKPSGLCKKYCLVTSCPYHGVGSVG